MLSTEKIGADNCGMETINSRNRPATATQVLAADADDSALLNARVCAKTAGISFSHFHSLLSRGLAPPADVRFGPRCVRWRAGTLRKWIADIAQQ